MYTHIYIYIYMCMCIEVLVKAPRLRIQGWLRVGTSMGYFRRWCSTWRLAGFIYARQISHGPLVWALTFFKGI